LKQYRGSTNLKETLKPAEGHVTYRQDGFPSSRTASKPAGRPDFQQDDDFHQQGCKTFSRTAISSGRTTKYLTGRRFPPAGRQNF
jgi:hypothetical protein